MEDLSNYDFSGKRVRYCGKALSKFEISYRISYLSPYSPYGIYPDAYLYSEYASVLKSLLSKNN